MNESFGNRSNALSGLTVLLITTVWPEWRSSAAGVRTLGVARACRGAGARVVFASHAHVTEFKAELEKEGFETQEIRLNDSELNGWLATLRPDIVIFDRFITEEQYSARVRQACPDALRVLDTSDFHSLRKFRELTPGAGSESSLHLAQQLLQDSRPPLADHLEREWASLIRSDGAWVVSPFEQQVLCGEVFKLSRDQVRVSRIRPLLDQVFIPYRIHDSRSPLRVGWIGNFRHPPNAAACQEMIRMWPQVRKGLLNSGAIAPELHLLGAYPPAEMVSQKGKLEGLQKVGPVPDAIVALGSLDVLWAPLRFGAGIKGKILDAWWAGKGVATTPVGIEGMESGRDLCTVVYEWTPRAWAEVLLREARLSANEVQKRNHIRAELWSSEWGSEAHDVQVVGDLLDWRTRLVECRQSNLTSRLIWREQMRSTDFFSRWLELKEGMKYPKMAGSQNEAFKK